jgi:hypothetical protein
MALGALAGMGHADQVIAACGSSYGVNCMRSKASLLEVNHEYRFTNPVAVGPTEPDSGETWEVKAYWATASGGECSCTETSATAYVDVDWNQGSNTWVAVCTSGCDVYGGPIFQVDICDDDTCTQTAGTLHSWKYVLRVEIAKDVDVCDSQPAYLNRVVYTTTSVDDGDQLSGTGLGCYEVTAVQPTSQTVTVTDTGAYQPGYTWVCYPGECLGPTPVTLTYD